MAGPLRIRCPHCTEDFPVPTEVLDVNPTTNLVTVVMDRTELYGHLKQCAAAHGAPQPSPTRVIVVRGSRSDVHRIGVPSSADLSGRIDRMLDMRAYVATGGSRACTMCGCIGQDCLTGLETKSGTPCCSACGNGNTHPAPNEGTTCAEWAVEYGCKQ